MYIYIQYFLILDSLDKKYEMKNEFDKVISNTESAFFKVFIY